ncbi:disulfide bond formation oxidoreductase DsbA [Geotalea daltonii FRC-32]|uniref:Thiol:disulfide interchange protein DsbA n=1 Tax=Geotalea daltonii (strain DSM 22248 / JCM 15807 / FRC-32) TaxID=316067 RepID=B9M1K1_GEODF|nr:thiol:disulfide interchange protein DsbA/DsbL [Geotalea daltonii]ACM21083.1 disulfide bond formation oxidoreductase DsbA [Geotalea daltonii FRC-32]
MSFKFAKTIAKSFALVALLAGTSFAFTEGTDYVKLAKPIPNAQGTLIKVFSYDCPFCYKYDKKITPNLVPKLPSDLKFRPFHLKTKGKYGVQGSELFAVLLLKDQKAGLSDRDLYTEKSLLKKAKMAYYTAYHDKRERWDAGPDAYLKTGLDAVGMTKADFDKAKNDPKVKALLKEWDQSYDVAKVQGVPGFVINGKYLIMTKSITSIDGMLKLINELKTK